MLTKTNEKLPQQTLCKCDTACYTYLVGSELGLEETNYTRVVLMN